MASLSPALDLGFCMPSFIKALPWHKGAALLLGSIVAPNNDRVR